MHWKKAWAIAFGIASLLGITAVLVSYFGRQAAGREISLGYAFLTTLPDWFFWAAVAPMVMWLSGRFRLEKGVWLARGAIHLIAGVLVALFQIAYFTILYRQAGYVQSGLTYWQTYTYPKYSAGTLSDPASRIV